MFQARYMTPKTASKVEATPVADQYSIILESSAQSPIGLIHRG